MRVKAQIEHLQTLYFRVFIRMTTCKESKENFFDSEVYGTILYDNFILDVPKIIDLCSLFGPSNEKLLVKMIDNVFKHQPKYLGDVKEAVPSLTKVCENVSLFFLMHCFDKANHLLMSKIHVKISMLMLKLLWWVSLTAPALIHRKLFLPLYVIFCVCSPVYRNRFCTNNELGSLNPHSTF